MKTFLNVAIFMATVTMWMVVIYVISNYVDFRMKRKGKENKIVDAIKCTSYDFCKPIVANVAKVLPPKYADFSPLLSFLLLRAIIFVLSVR